MRNEVNLLEALDMTDLEEDALIKLAEAGQFRMRLAGGQLYFLREEIEGIVDRAIEEARAGGES